MTAKVNTKFFSYLDDIGAKVKEVHQDSDVRAALAFKLCMHFWPELDRVQAEIVVDTWTRSFDAATATEEKEQQNISA